MSVIRLGFIGFGEAAQRFAQDFTAAGVSSIIAYSPSAARAAPDDALHARAAATGVGVAGSVRDVLDRSDLVFALTPGSAALQAVRTARPYLRPDHIYIDASTAAVRDMERAAKLVGNRAQFVDAAVMDPVPMNGIRTQTVISGPAAERVCDLLVPLGMNLQIVGDQPGAASAMKLMRSVCMKGLAALLLESLEAAQRYGITDALVADMARFLDGRPFEQVVKRFVCGSAIHAERRIHEVTESMALLKSLGASTVMTRATRSMLQSIDRMDLRARFDAREPATIHPVLEAIVDSKTRARLDGER